MKFKKLFLFFALTPLLVSCANKSIAGTYGFQLGKETGTHFGITLALTDTAFAPEQGDETVYEDGLKRFEFSVSAKMSESDEQSSSAIDSILDYFKDSDGNATIPGYYKLTDDVSRSGERRIKLGISFKYVADKLASIVKEETGKDVDSTQFNELNNSSIIQNLLCATYKDDTVNVYIPVSFNDLYYQLYWYGTDIKITFDPTKESIEEMIDFDIIEVTPHQFGTYPTKEEIAQINETFIPAHEGALFTEFKTFYQIKLGLMKK